ncbi:MAG: DNA topoisomerase, partial [Nanoarchaeota archaeon]|nr:DNA topoisomerase [Nanoarchaeota archaeon]
MYELIICEKPQAAMKVADALADGKAIKENNAGVPYYNITRGSRDIIVACAVGHLYGLAQTEGKKGEFPVFNIEWQASHLSRKGAAFTKKYLNTLIKLAKGADEFTIATDYDVEGEVIGWNVVRFACKQKDANRMKFSTLLKEDLQEAYEHKTNHLNWGQAKAGETRHKLDWFHGINFSRALTHAVKSTGAFKLMSTGRVQGPALKIVVDREKEIKAFKPDPFWQIQLLGTVNKGNLEAWHVADKFWEKTKADAVMEKVANKTEGTVTDLKKKQFNQSPPTPFDLTTLQTESYRCFGL